MIAIVYFVLGYWAAGRTVFADKVVIGTPMAIFAQKMAVGLLLGWILIPVALIKMLFGH